MENYPDLQELPNPELGEHLGVRVLVMGLSWAVYLAHMCLTSIATGLQWAGRPSGSWFTGARCRSWTSTPASTACSGSTSAISAP